MVTEQAVPMSRGLGSEVKVEVYLHWVLMEQAGSNQHCQVPSLEKEKMKVIICLCTHLVLKSDLRLIWVCLWEQRGA